MIMELSLNNFSKIKPLLKGLGLEKHPVINGVLDGNNRGRVFVDCTESPTTAFVWAKMEMFYLLGNSGNLSFIEELDNFMIDIIKPAALAIGDNDFNLEIYPYEDWKKVMNDVFRVPLNKGLRVPFVFDRRRFIDFVEKRSTEIAHGYELALIDETLAGYDLIDCEILKFWETLDDFYRHGLGYCVLKDGEVIGTCISAFVSGVEYEIGINTYGIEHRGKGIASNMAMAFISECLERGGIPHWTTEHFRKDSITIALKMGFVEMPRYEVYYLGFAEWE
ncbi:GNAT family N-acetyltransferase [Pseudoneobacillus sp. C159]